VPNLMFAGQYGPNDLRAGPTLTLPGTVFIYAVGTTTPVTLYTDRTMGTTASNPLTTGVSADTAGVDLQGNALWFAPVGRYDMNVDGATYTVAVYPDPEDLTNAMSGAAWAIYNVSTATWPLRSSVTTNPNQLVVWLGLASTPAPPGGGYAAEGDVELVSS
jgi:hypothetical protein